MAMRASGSTHLEEIVEVGTLGHTDYLRLWSAKRKYVLEEKRGSAWLSYKRWLAQAERARRLRFVEGSGQAIVLDCLGTARLCSLTPLEMFHSTLIFVSAPIKTERI